MALVTNSEKRMPHGNSRVFLVYLVKGFGCDGFIRHLQSEQMNDKANIVDKEREKGTDHYFQLGCLSPDSMKAAQCPEDHGLSYRVSLCI